MISTGGSKSATRPSHFVPFLAQQIRQACAQILGRLATGFLADLHTLLGDCRRFLQKLLSDRKTVERVNFAQLIHRKVAGIQGSSAVDHRGIVWRVRIPYLRCHRIIVALDLWTTLYQRRLDTQENDWKQRLVLIR